MSLRVIRLNEFIRQSETEGRELPPFVHTTPSARIVEILRDSKLLVTECNVFCERLCYLFVGRPAYKWKSDGEASVWQLPFVVLVNNIDTLSLKRIYPFDTGAFSSRRLPDYITLFNRENYNVGKNVLDAERIIKTFFTNTKNYMNGKAKSEDDMRETYNLGVKHQEISALARLYNDKSNSSFDDRSKVIELQISEDLNISKENVIGLVLPKQYADDADIQSAISKLECEVETYGEFPLNVDNYYGMIYQSVNHIMRRKGFK